MVTAYSGGGCGDIVYQIPAMQELGVQHVYLYEPFYPMMKRLLEWHGFTCSVGFKEQATYNMDDFRKQPLRGWNHIMMSIANQFKTKQPDFKPWLDMSTVTGPYSVVQVTPRWRQGSTVNWRRVIEGIKGDVWVVGLPHEHAALQAETGLELKYHPTDNIHHLAVLISYCGRFYGNQSVGVALAQGLGKPYSLELKPGKRNVRTFTSNETILT